MPIRVNRTIDTRIFSTGERSRGREEAEDREGVSSGPTEPPRPTEPIPSPADRTCDRTRAGGHAGQGVAAGSTELGPNRGMPNGKRVLQAQRLVRIHAAVSNLFNLGRHLIAAGHYRTLRQGAHASWDEAVAI